MTVDFLAEAGFPGCSDCFKVLQKRYEPRRGMCSSLRCYRVHVHIGSCCSTLSTKLSVILLGIDKSIIQIVHDASCLRNNPPYSRTASFPVMTEPTLHLHLVSCAP